MAEKSDEKVLYTDGHDVTVTDSTLQVRKQEYQLNGVTRCGVNVIHPRRAPAIVLLVLGITLVGVGMMRLVPPRTIPEVNIANTFIDGNMLVVWIGAALAVIGILVIGLVRERYAVRISTAEGDKDAVVSRKKEYIHQIVDAINQAISFVRTRTGSRYFTVRGSDTGRPSTT